MRIPLHLSPCTKCGKRTYVWINLHDTSFENICRCGEEHSGFLASDITVGFRALYRSQYELVETEDHILSMVFSATAVEWDLYRLFQKWMGISAMESGYQVSDETLDEMFRKHKTIFNKFKETGKLMYPQGFEKFVRLSPEFRDTVEKGFPSLQIESLIDDIREMLFEPRNRILHAACIEYDEKAAWRSYNIAHLTLLVLQGMDKYRIDSYDVT